MFKSRISLLCFVFFISWVVLPLDFHAAALSREKQQETKEEKTKKSSKKEIKPYEEIITEEAKSDEGLFTVHQIDDKLYYEIPEKMLSREMLLVSRMAKTPPEGGYGGQKTNTQVIRWQKQDKKILLRIVSYINTAEENMPIFRAVQNSNLEPIAAKFDIAAKGKDSRSVVIEVTTLFNKDVPFLGLSQRQRKNYKVKRLDPERSFLKSANSYPKNIEVRNVLTYAAAEPPSLSSIQSITVEMHHSMVILPEKPMQPRMWDERVGYFTVEQTDYGVEAQRAVKRRYITRWRLEPSDKEAFLRGEAVKPVKPIVFYIDPATPMKWRPYIKKGVEDWQPAFEAAGFKDAIMAKDPPAPEENPEFTPEDARYSVIRYFPSEIMNAYGPHVHDPRSGEIIESDIGLYHNVLNLLRNWYFIQTSAANPKARGIEFKDEVMGRLLRYVVAHEVGHTLGLPHNMKASSTYTIKQLRDPEFTEKNGTTPSIMDYARFNYVAQPGDGIENFVPVIGPYDIYSIRWGYRPIPKAETPEGEKPILDKWILEKYDNPVYRFNDGSSYDPTSQSEAVGDDPVEASRLGIANLERITENLIQWTYRPRKDYSQLEELYSQVISQWNRYMGHVSLVVGGVVKTRKTTDQPGPVFEIVSREKQRNAMKFLNDYAFTTPKWMIAEDVLNRIEHAGIVNRIRSLQVRTLSRLMDFHRMQRLIEAEAVLGGGAYTLGDLFQELHKGIWKELNSDSSVGPFRRNLQKGFIDRCEYLMTEEPEPVPPRYRRFIERTEVKVSQSDIRSFVRGELITIKKEIEETLNKSLSPSARLHYEDIKDRIVRILSPYPKVKNSKAN